MGQYQQESKVLKALAHPVRMQIMKALARRPLCVCELVMLTRRRQAYISQHLALLREVELVCYDREGANIFYRVNAVRLAELMEYLDPFLSLANSVAETMMLQGDDELNDNNKGQWHGISRAEIHWQPAVIKERCVGCGLCVTSCGRGVYAFDYESNHPAVVAPEMCMVGCTTCATLCTQDAIEFPSTGYIRQLIRQKKLLRQSKDMLRDNREKYDLKMRELRSL